MSILVHNTLTRKKEIFEPQHGKTVTMYVCGVTPYDEVHLGHARAYVTFDIVRRHLEHSGYTVRYIQNFTDVDDKIIRRAAERGVSPVQLADTYIDDYFTQMDRLGIRRADAYPRVTESIPQIIAFIQTLIDKGVAYELNGDVYYAVRKFPEYGKLSKRSIEELQSGARVAVDEQKRDPLDFALWKKSKPGEPEEVSWDSPWGKGRPGWHIECSVMAVDTLGATLDIHGGGQDLIFPHHENEVAQSEAATGKPFAKYWIHNGFVTVNAEKMSKSLGNFFTLKDIFTKFPPRVVRFFLLSQHYRSPLDFSDARLQQAQNALEGLDEAFIRLSETPLETQHPGALENLETEIDTETAVAFREALDDDFNTEKAIAVLYDYKRKVMSGLATMSPVQLRSAYETFRYLMGDYLGIPVVHREAIPADVMAVKEERDRARKEKNWKLSDDLRAKLTGMGYRVEDKPGGVSILTKTAAS